MADRTFRVWFEAQTSQFTARVAAAEQQLGRLDRAPRNAARAIGLLQSGMQQLSFQATGATGPLGRVAAGMGTLAIGSPVMLGIMAGIGGVTALIKFLGREADESKKRIDGFLESLRSKELQAFLPGRSLATREAEKAALLAERAGLPLAPAGVAPSMLSAEEARAAARVLAIDKELLTINHEIGLARRDIAAETEKTAVTAEREAEALTKAVDRMVEYAAARALAAQAAEREAAAALVPRPSAVGGGVLPGTFGARLLRAEEETAGRRAIADAQGLGAIMEKLSGTFQVARISVDVYADAIKQQAAAAELATTLVITAAGQLIQGIINAGRTGGARGVLSGLLGGAGLIGTLFKASNPLVAGLSIGGGILSSLIGGGRRDPQPVRLVGDDTGISRQVEMLQRKIEALEQRRPKQVTNQFVSGRGLIQELVALLRREGALTGEPLL